MPTDWAKIAIEGDEQEQQGGGTDWAALALGDQQAPAVEAPDMAGDLGDLNALNNKLKKLPAAQRKKAYADLGMRLAKERRAEQPEWRRGVNDFSRNLIRGMPGGSFLDEYIAGSGANDTPYEIEQATQKALNKISEDESTSYGELPYIGEVKQSGVNKLLGAAVTAPLAPVVRGAGMIGSAALTGLGYGALQGAGEDEGFGRVGNALIGGGVGGVTGGLFSVGAGLAGRAVGAARNRQPQVLNQYDRGAVQRVGNAVNVADRQGNITDRAIRVGERGTLADLGEAPSQYANALANKFDRVSDEAGTIIRDTIRRRDRQSGQIVDDAADAALGRYRPAKQTARQTRQAANRAARPYYQAYENVTMDLGNLRRPINDVINFFGETNEGIAKSFREAAYKGGASARSIGNAGVVLDRMKRRLDGMEGVARKSGDNDQVRRIGELRTNLVEAIDDQLDSRFGFSVYREARRRSARGQQFAEGVKEGRKDVMGAKSADDFAEDTRRATASQRAGQRLGARAQIQELTERVKDAYARQDIKKGRKLITELSAPATRRKIRQIATSAENADDLAAAVTAEGEMMALRQLILGNSKTAATQSAQEAFPGEFVGEVARAPMSTYQEARVAALRLINYATAGAINRRRQRIATDAARMLMAQGADRDMLVTALRQRASGQNATRETVAAAQNIIRNLMAPAATAEATAITGE